MCLKTVLVCEGCQSTKVYWDHCQTYWSKHYAAILSANPDLDPIAEDCVIGKVLYQPMGVGLCPSVGIDAEVQCSSWLWALQRRMDVLREEDEQEEIAQYHRNYWAEWEKITKPFAIQEVAPRSPPRSFVELATRDMADRVREEERNAQVQSFLDRFSRGVEQDGPYSPSAYSPSAYSSSDYSQSPFTVSPCSPIVASPAAAYSAAVYCLRDEPDRGLGELMLVWETN